MISGWGNLITMFLALIFLSPPKTLFHQPILSNHVVQIDCDSILEKLTEDEDWLEQMINPILITPEEISNHYALYSNAYNCIGNDIESLSEGELVVRTLIEYFLIFAGGFETAEVDTTLFSGSFDQFNDPSIIKIRDEAGISTPEGIIFVRLYSSRDAMPKLVKQAFESDDVAGVTILSRYIAVLNENKDTWHEKELLNQTLPETISHELVHAYINSLLGYQSMDLPEWYSEGIAIYFSGSGKGHTVISPDFSISTTPPEEYRQYDINFKYLEKKVGRKQFLERIKQSVEQVDSEILYQDLGIANDQVLVARASVWHQQQMFIRVGIFLLGIIFVGWRVMKLMPEARCKNCGFAGKKKEFRYGYCPRCFHRL